TGPAVLGFGEEGAGDGEGLLGPQGDGAVRFPLDDLEHVAEMPAEEVDAVGHPGADPGGRFGGDGVDKGEDVLDGPVDVGAGLDVDHERSPFRSSGGCLEPTAAGGKTRTEGAVTTGPSRGLPGRGRWRPVQAAAVTGGPRPAVRRRPAPAGCGWRGCRRRGRPRPP